jgi:Transposase C of IS166 homeodomain
MEQALDLPIDIESLHMLVSQLLSENQHRLNQKNHLQEQVRLLLHKRYSDSSEKYNANQADIFNEAESFAKKLASVKLRFQGTLSESTLPGMIHSKQPPPRSINPAARHYLPNYLARNKP